MTPELSIPSVARIETRASITPTGHAWTEVSAYSAEGTLLHSIIFHSGKLHTPIVETRKEPAGG